MDFRDGNDPSAAPGARVIYPDADNDLAFDPVRQAVVRHSTGEWMRFRITDREDRSFDSAIWDAPGGPFVVQGYVGQIRRAGFGESRAYNITHLRRFAQDGGRPADYPIDNVAAFLNSYPDPFSRSEYTGHVVVIDNRRR